MLGRDDEALQGLISDVVDNSRFEKHFMVPGKNSSYFEKRANEFKIFKIWA